MRYYKSEKFALKAAEHAQDVLDQHLFDIALRSDAPSPGSNIGRAGRTHGLRAGQTLETMHAIEQTWLSLCKIKLPANLTTAYSERLREIRWELLDISEEISDLWKSEASEIWNGLSFKSRVSRLCSMADALTECVDVHDRDLWVGHLRWRLRQDPVAAQAARVHPEIDFMMDARMPDDFRDVNLDGGPALDDQADMVQGRDLT